MKLFKYILALLLLAGLILPVPVLAETDTFTPFVQIREEYSDNVLFSTNNEKEDFITTPSAGLTYNKDEERTKARLTGILKHQFYYDNDQLDDTDGSVSGSFDRQLTEKLGMGASASYRQDSRRDEDTDTTGLVLAGDRSKGDFSLSGNMLFSELMKGEMTAGYGFDRLDKLDGDENSKTYSLNLALTRNMSRIFNNTTGLLNFNYFRYSSEAQTVVPASLQSVIYDQKVDSDVFQLYTGFSKAITELYSFYLQGGASYTKTTEKLMTHYRGLVNQDVASADQDSDTWGGVLLTGVNYNGEYYDVGLSLSRDMRGSSGTNGTVERTSASLNISGRLTESFSWTFDASCYLNQNERTNRDDLDELTYNVQPGFRFKFWDTYTLTGAYRFTTVENRTNDTSRERNLVYIQIRKNFDFY